jgi:hypothetical protein
MTYSGVTLPVIAALHPFTGKKLFIISLINGPIVTFLCAEYRKGTAHSKYFDEIHRGF